MAKGERQSAQLTDLHVQMKITNKLLAAQLKDRMKQNELIALLANTGATNSEIAEVLGTTPNTVGVALSRRKKKTTGI